MHRHAVEQHLEAFVCLLLREFEARRGGQFADIHFADAYGRLACDEQELSLGVGRDLPVAGVFEDDVFRGRDAVEEDRHTVADDLHLHRIPLPGAVRGCFGCGVVVEPVARQGSGVLAAEGDLRNRADTQPGLCFGLPFEDQFEIFVILRRAYHAGVSRSGQDAAGGGPVLRHGRVGLLLRFRQRLGLHLLAGLGIADHGLPAVRFERYRGISPGGEFGHQALDLVDGVTGVGVGFGQPGIYLHGLFQCCGNRLAAQRGVLRGDGLHDQRRRFGRRGGIHVVHGERQGGEYRGFGEGFEQFVLHLGRGCGLQAPAVELVFAHRRIARLGDEIRVARYCGVGPCGVLPGELVEHFDHRGVLHREQGCECGLPVVGFQQRLDGVVGRRLRQQGVIPGFLGRCGHLPCHHLVLHVGSLLGQGVFQSGLQGLHVILLRLVQQAAQTVEVCGGRDAGQRVVGCRAHLPVRGVQQGEHLAGGGGDAPFGDELQGVGLRGGISVECRYERGVGLSVECREGRRRLFGVCACQLCDERVQCLLPADLSGGADGCQSQFFVGRGDGCNHGVGLRCGMTCAQPAHDVGFRSVGERRHLLHDGGVKGVVGEIAGEVERSAAVFAVGVFQRCEYLRGLFSDIRTQYDPQPCGPDVLRH